VLTVYVILGSYKHAYDVLRTLVKEKATTQSDGSFEQLFDNRVYELELQ